MGAIFDTPAIIAWFLLAMVGAFLAGDWRGHSAAATKDKAALSGALEKEAADSAKKQTALVAAYNQLDKDDDDDIQYGAQLERKLAAMEKSYPMPANCAGGADVVRLINSASSTSADTGGAKAAQSVRGIH